MAATENDQYPSSMLPNSARGLVVLMAGAGAVGGRCSQRDSSYSVAGSGASLYRGRRAWALSRGRAVERAKVFEYPRIPRDIRFRGRRPLESKTVRCQESIRRCQGGQGSRAPRRRRVAHEPESRRGRPIARVILRPYREVPVAVSIRIECGARIGFKRHDRLRRHRVRIPRPQVREAEYPRRVLGNRPGDVRAGPARSFAGLEIYGVRGGRPDRSVGDHADDRRGSASSRLPEGVQAAVGVYCPPKGAVPPGFNG